MKRGCWRAYALIGRIEQTYSTRFSEQTKRKFMQEAGGLHGLVDYIDGRDRLFALAREHQQQAVRQAVAPQKAQASTAASETNVRGTAFTQAAQDWLDRQIQRSDEYDEYLRREGYDRRTGTFSKSSHHGFIAPGTRRFVTDVPEAKRILDHYRRFEVK